MSIGTPSCFFLLFLFIPGLVKSITATTDEVMTTRFTEGALAADSRTERVPLIAGSNRSRLMSFDSKVKGEAVWKIPATSVQFVSR
jgi:hypothetical protein